MEKAILIDGNSLMFRAFYGSYKTLENFDQNNIFPTNAIKTMMLMIFSLIKEKKYNYGIIAFDHKDKNFRKQEFDFYKANRKTIPEALVKQIPVIFEIMPFFGLHLYCISGIEADDIIGSMAKEFSKQNIISDIYSSDNDMLQLVDDKINFYRIKNGVKDFELFNIENFYSLVNLHPKQIIDYKSLCGDSSDNLPGVHGIGKQTAIKLLNEFTKLENIYINIDLIKNNSLKEKLIKDKENAFISKKLATIKTDYFENININELKLNQINIVEIKKYIFKYKFRGFDKYIKWE